MPSWLKHIRMTDGNVFLNNNIFHIGDGIGQLMLISPSLALSDSNKYFDIFQFADVKGISLFVKENLVTQMAISLFPNRDSFKGDIHIGNKLLPIPFYARDVDSFFPGLLLKKLPSIYNDVYDTDAFNLYSFSEQVKYDIKVNRDNEHIGLISLRIVSDLLTT